MPYDFGHDLFPRLLAQGCPLYAAYVCTYFLAIDTPEVHITRRVYRSGEGEYLINRQPCRLRDIRDLFAGTGVATEAYSVIEQGKVLMLDVATGQFSD